MPIKVVYLRKYASKLRKIGIEDKSFIKLLRLTLTEVAKGWVDSFKIWIHEES